MRLLNGLFAFATIFFMTGTVVAPDRFLASTYRLVWIELLLYWHIFWYVFTKPSKIFSRWFTMFPLTCILVFLLGLSHPPSAFGTRGMHALSFLVESLRLLAICDIVFCMQMIRSSLPSSLRIKARQTTSAADTPQPVSRIAQAPAD
jgi:hypothetical protein